MSSVTGRAAGFIATLYLVDSVISSKDLTTVAATAVVGNIVKDVADMGSLTKARNIIDIPVYGADTMSKLPGQADPGTFDFNVTFNMDDVTHKALRDDDGLTPHTLIIKFTQGTNVTYAAFDGYVATADVTAPIDDRIQMDVSIARDGGVTWLDAA
jgi:hypothetical protein